MYIPEHFRETASDEIADVLAAYPLACIVAQTEQGLIANHLPLLKGNSNRLVGHVALANDMHRLIPQGAPVLTIFRGDDGYISANDYPSKHEAHRQVPTWNYQAVHIHGTITFQNDTAAKRAAVALLTRDHERRRHGAAGWRMTDAPPDYIDQMLDGIVAFQIRIDRILAKSKLSQNKDPRDILGASAGLRSVGKAALAEKMTQRSRLKPLE
jgi:transcriptional regulator